MTKFLAFDMYIQEGREGLLWAILSPITVLVVCPFAVFPDHDHVNHGHTLEVVKFILSAIPLEAIQNGALSFV